MIMIMMVILLVPFNHEHKENAGCAKIMGLYVPTCLLLMAHMYHAHTFIEVHRL